MASRSMLLFSSCKSRVLPVPVLPPRITGWAAMASGFQLFGVVSVDLHIAPYACNLVTVQSDSHESCCLAFVHNIHGKRGFFHTEARITYIPDEGRCNEQLGSRSSLSPSPPAIASHHPGPSAHALTHAATSSCLSVFTRP